MPTPRIFSNTAVILPPLVLGILLAASNYRLARENRRVGALAQYYASLRHPTEGAVLPDLHGKDLDGRDLTISYRPGGAETLLLVFSPVCPHCKRNWPAWRDLLHASEGRRVVFVNVGKAIPDGFSQVYSFDAAAVMARTDPESVLRYSLLETPLTILVSPDGHCEKVWTGELSAGDLADAERRLHGETAR